MFKWLNKVINKLFGEPTPYKEVPVIPALELKNVAGRKIAIVVGHIPGGGAKGHKIIERDFNMEVARHMLKDLADNGADVQVYYHAIRHYGKRQDRLRKNILRQQGKCDIVIELHCNAFSSGSAKGAEYLYRGYKNLALCFAKSQKEMWPSTALRRSGGTYRKTSGNGAGFLLKAPGPAVLTEPFFLSNKGEADIYRGNEEKLADCYCLACDDFLKSS